MRVYLTNRASDVSSTYKLATIDTRNPEASALVTAVTNTTGSGNDIQMTATAGGTALAWITPPLPAITIPAIPIWLSSWAMESNALANAGIGVILAKYTSSEQAAFLTDHVDALELTTAITQHRVQTGLPTSTAFAAGDRLVIKMTVAAVGTMGASQTVTMDYDGPTAEADGDSYIDVGVIATPTRVQFGAGGAQPLSGLGKGYFVELANLIDVFTGSKFGSSEMTLAAAKAQALAERDAR